MLLLPVPGRYDQYHQSCTDTNLLGPTWQVPTYLPRYVQGLPSAAVTPLDGLQTTYSLHVPVDPWALQWLHMGSNFQVILSCFHPTVATLPLGIPFS